MAKKVKRKTGGAKRLKISKKRGRVEPSKNVAGEQGVPVERTVGINRQSEDVERPNGRGEGPQISPDG